ncbi:MAG: ROK family protein [Alphaproteobacteria bacterium]|nr:ROK family protein [Alphaproteobacteria bacterium]
MRIGVDVGGTKIEAAALNAAGELTLRRRVPTPSGDYQAAIEAIADLIGSIEAEIGQRCPVGFGIPGTISPATNMVKNAYNSPFNGHPLNRDLERQLNRPIRMTNDANCFALSEATDGAAAGAATVFGVILGTGCGGGIVIDGKVLVGANAIGGEWGHNPLPWPLPTEQPGNRCSCGLTGCIETFLSGTGFAAHHRAETGDALEPREIAQRAANGDKVCADSLARYESRLARALASVINLIDPDVIVLGGGMSNIETLYTTVPSLWSEWVFSDHVDTRLVPPAFGDSSGVRGAAWLWPTDDPT